jgi:dihydroxyacid dehydratase/phosphogluconate dehydratase
MGTASTMNAMAEALGMTLPGRRRSPRRSASGWRWPISPAAHRRMAQEDLKPSDILTRAAFLNAIKVNTAIGGSTNAPPHLQAIARHMGVELDVTDWQTVGFDLPLLVNMQPAGEYLGESFFRAGGVPAVMGELLAAGQLHGGDDGHGQTDGREPGTARAAWIRDVIRPSTIRCAKRRGSSCCPGNLFDSALMKTSVISRISARGSSRDDGSARPRGRLRGPRGLPRPDQRPRAGHRRGDHPLHPQRVGCVGYPGSAEVVNMQPPDALIRAGINHLPTVGDGRQSGTSESPSILNASPEAVVGGGLALSCRPATGCGSTSRPRGSTRWWTRRVGGAAGGLDAAGADHQTPWQELYRTHVGQLADGGCLELATAYQRIAKDLPRDNH